MNFVWIFIAGLASKSMGKQIGTISKTLLDILSVQPFPGNVRKLKSYIYDVAAQCHSGALSENDIMDRLFFDQPGLPQSPSEETAALIAEPVSGEGGFITPSPD